MAPGLSPLKRARGTVDGAGAAAHHLGERDTSETSDSSCCSDVVDDGPAFYNESSDGEPSAYPCADGRSDEDSSSEDGDSMLVHTNQDMAAEVGLGGTPYHRGFAYEPGSRKIELPSSSNFTKGLPEHILVQRHEELGCKVPLVLSGRKTVDGMLKRAFGAAFPLTPPQKDSTGRTTMMLASVAHVARGMRDAVYVSAEVDYPPRRMNHTSPVDEPAATLKSARRSLPAGIVKMHAARGYYPEVQTRAASPAYPALSACSNRPLKRNPDLIIFKLSAPEDQNQDLFPFKSCLAWNPDMGEDVLFPCHLPPALDGSTWVALTGCAETYTEELVEARYGIAPGPAAHQAIKEMERCLPPKQAVISVGDVVGYDGFHMSHRASCSRGMSGSPVRRVEEPQLFYGIHSSANGCSSHNVAISANHPVLVAWYARDVVPQLVDVPEDHWARPYMLPALRAYLLHHHTLLTSLNLWTASVQQICSAAS